MRCDDKSLTREKDDPPCESEEEIDKFIEKLELEVIVVNKQLDTKKKDGSEPTFIAQSTQGSSILDTTKATTYNLYLDYNYLTTEDDLV